MSRKRNKWGKLLTVLTLAAVLTGCKANNTGSGETTNAVRETDSDLLK